MSYVDLASVHVPSTGGVAPAAWGLQIRENFEFGIDPPACSVFDTGQSVPHNTFTILNASQENYDNDAMHSTITNNSRITAQTAGRYLVTATVAFAAGNTGTRQLSFRLNGTILIQGLVVLAASAVFQSRLTATRTVTLTVGDYLETRVFHFQGAALDVNLDEFALTFLTR